MKNILQFLIILNFGLFISCVSEGPTTNNDSTTSDTTEQPSDYQEDTPGVTTSPTKPTCETEGTVLDGNVFWAKEANILVCITAGAETKDEEYGDSHRILEVYNGENCELIEKTILSVNVSPDFPYYIADRSYNQVNQWIAIKGFDKIYCYDAKNQKLSAPLSPKFLNERYAEDAQSGMIKRLEVWEDYLIGYAQDMGVFVFDLSNGEAKSVEPFAEYEIVEGESYHSLFMLQSANNTAQVLFPSYDGNDNFNINALLDKPRDLVTQMNRRFRDNRFIILKENQADGSQIPIAVDMKNQITVSLPEAVKVMKNTEIIDWLKQNS